MASERIAMIHEIIPKEIMVLILKKLDFQTLTTARKVCAKWRNLIHGFDLFNIKTFGKFCLKMISHFDEDYFKRSIINNIS